MPHVSREGATIYYEETGAGTPLVFVHGGWSNADAWTPQVEWFADDYRVITLDIRGHGETGASERGRYSIDLFADDLEAVLDALDAVDPVLCGLSLGSMVVQSFLDSHPERAAGAILAGPVRSMSPPGAALLGPFASPLPALATSLSMTGSRATFRSMLSANRVTNGGPWLAVDDAVRGRAIETAGDVPPREFRKIFAALYRFDPPGLSGLSTPTLVVYGESEAARLKRQGGQIAAAVERGEETVVPDAGHLVNLDNPEGFNAVCESFLDRFELAS